MPVTPEELRALLDAPEGETLEFKAARSQFDTRKVIRYACALANEGGGKLILGVADKTRDVVGTPVGPSDYVLRVHETLGFRIEFQAFDIDGLRVVVIDVPSRPPGQAYQVDGCYFMRAGESLVGMTSDRLRMIFDEGKSHFCERAAASLPSVEDVRRHLNLVPYFELQDLPVPKDGGLERFVSEKLIRSDGSRWEISNLAALLFANDLGSFDLSRKAPRFIRYAGTNKLKTTADVFGTRGYTKALPGIVKHVKAAMPHNELIQEAIRKTIPMVPLIAVRELVANALIHQDLEQPGRVDVELYEDRVEVSNPGLPIISFDRFIDGYQSRNESLADLLRRLGLCEEKGSGIDKIVNAAEAQQLPPPHFRAGAKRTIAIVFGPRRANKMFRPELVRACYQHCCLMYVSNKSMTNATLRARLGLEKRQSSKASKVIGSALAEGLIRREEGESKKLARYIPAWA